MEGGEEIVRTSCKGSLELGLHWPSQTACNGSDTDEQNCHSSQLEIMLIDWSPRAKPTMCVCEKLLNSFTDFDIQNKDRLHQDAILTRSPDLVQQCDFSLLLQTHCASRSPEAVISFLHSGYLNRAEGIRNPESDALCHGWNTFMGLFSLFFNILEETGVLICFCEDTWGWQLNWGYAVLLLNLFVKVYPGKWVIIPNDLFSSWEFSHSTKAGAV